MNEEKPVVVVLKPGDLTAEEAEKIKEKEELGKYLKNGIILIIVSIYQLINHSFITFRKS